MGGGSSNGGRVNWCQLRYKEKTQERRKGKQQQEGMTEEVGHVLLGDLLGICPTWLAWNCHSHKHTFLTICHFKYYLKSQVYAVMGSQAHAILLEQRMKPTTMADSIVFFYDSLQDTLALVNVQPTQSNCFRAQATLEDKLATAYKLVTILHIAQKLIINNQINCKLNFAPAT